MTLAVTAGVPAYALTGCCSQLEERYHHAIVMTARVHVVQLAGEVASGSQDESLLLGHF